jgi:cytochrome P450
MATTDVYCDPYDYSIDSDPYPIWKRLRDEAPIYHNEKLGFYALSRYDDVLAGLLDHETFISSHGITMEMITDEPAGIPMMIMMDPPEHTYLRKIVSRAFTPRRILALEGGSPNSAPSCSIRWSAPASLTMSLTTPASSRRR